MEKSHSDRYNPLGDLPIKFVHPPAPALEIPTRDLIQCDHCEAMVFPDAMSTHFLNFHSDEAQLREILEAAKQFSFVLLPPGKRDLRLVIEGYRRIAQARGCSIFDGHFDWDRLGRLEQLNPVARFVGVKRWGGYVVFKFDGSDKVVLECPRTGNATYVLAGEWREMISSTKAELRSEYRRLTTRIVHTSNWYELLLQSVFGTSV